MNKPNPRVDAYFTDLIAWRGELEKLRKIVLGCGLTEELKWGKPCYTVGDGNVVILQGFKAHCALLFCKGALLKDPAGILKKPGENTQAARRLEFTGVREIVARESEVKAYVLEAVAIEKSGLEVDFKKEPEPLPAELKRKLAGNPALKAAFAALTPGRQRAYILHFSGAKQPATRESRIEKCAPRILEGKGLND